eukprot:TRINITY_DN439_c0_g1_i1.p1 TRINITY_DN439_c0_g1~~TRINITY_DN439_c0_g1_i1.p1  ORF type:complete len:704 (-),score=99.88 TRINITY_DN439_c0_g1_i1:1990-4101(-)
MFVLNIMSGMIAFVPNFVPPFRGAAAKFRSTKLRSTPACGTKPKVQVKAMVKSSSHDDGWGADDFDRDYYDELKEQFKHRKNVHIFAKEDYELDDMDAPYLFDNRARDLEQIRKEMTTRPKAKLDEHVRPDHIMLMSDMHTEAELEHFKSTLRTCDAINGKVWQDPMPESDLDGDPEHIHFRKSPKPERDPRDEELPALLGETNLLKRKQFENEQDEIDALQRSCDMMDTDYMNEPVEPFSLSGNVDVPDPEEFSRWQAEAAVRGGGATRGESYFLPPFKDPMDILEGEDPSEQPTPPHQHNAFFNANCGEWHGTVRVFSLQTGNKFAPHLTACLSLHSSVEKGADKRIVWNSTISEESLDHVSDIHIPSPRHREALVPGRAVSADGCYVVCRKNGISLKDTEFFTMSRVCLEAITTDKTCRPELEIGMRSEYERLPVRHRIFLCTSTGKKKIKAKGGEPQLDFSHIIVLKEFLSTSLHRFSVDSQERLLPSSLGLEVISGAKLFGLWRGRGVVLHPEYPPMSCHQFSTSYRTSREENITENDVSWVENQIPDNPNQVSRRRERTVKKRKVSRRVREARLHDRRRLASCELLTSEKSGAIEEQRFAWKALPSVDAFSSMYSPRIGHFIGDYAALVVSKQLLLMFPMGNAFPNIWNTVSAIELSVPSRLRIEAGRNDQGTLVGALFVNETLEESTESDAVASYV